MKQTIALVDDDRNILTSVAMTLEQEGFTVRTFTDGESALQDLTARPVDLAVLDIKMPRMDGMELLQRLRQRTSLPVIFLTSKDEEVDELMGLRLGADDYITKPFSQRLLIERIRALLRPGSRAVDQLQHGRLPRGHIGSEEMERTGHPFLLRAQRPGRIAALAQTGDEFLGIHHRLMAPVQPVGQGGFDAHQKVRLGLQNRIGARVEHRADEGRRGLLLFGEIDSRWRFGHV